MKPLKSGRAKAYSRPLASKSRGALALPAIQLVPPLSGTMSKVCSYATKIIFLYFTSAEEGMFNRPLSVCMSVSTGYCLQIKLLTNFDYSF